MTTTPQEHNEQQLQAIQGATVLLVEDSPINQQVAIEHLHQAGLEVKLAENGQEAVAMTEQEHFDAILMDIQMPVMDGFDATQIIRILPGGDDLPIIAMTADGMQADREKCLAAGMNDHIVKSIDPSLLYQALVKWIKPRNGIGE